MKLHNMVVTDTKMTCSCGETQETFNGAYAMRFAHQHAIQNRPGGIQDKRSPVVPT